MMSNVMARRHGKDRRPDNGRSMAVDGSAAQPGLLKAGAVGWVVEAAACPVRFVTIVDVGCAWVFTAEEDTSLLRIPRGY